MPTINQLIKHGREKQVFKKFIVHMDGLLFPSDNFFAYNKNTKRKT